MYNKYLGGTKVIRYVINKEKYSRRKETRDKIKVCGFGKKAKTNEELTIGHAIVALIIFAFILKIIF